MEQWIKLERTAVSFSRFSPWIQIMLSDNDNHGELGFYDIKGNRYERI